MSGIVGIYYIDGRPVDPEIFARAAQTLSQRGPDGIRTLITSNLGLAHGALWTTPQSRLETWPFEAGDLMLVGDLRLDQRAALADRLSLTDTAVENIPDNQLLLNAYRKWGSACANHLHGDFAIAIWDRSRRQLFLARDPIGAKPLYYYANRRLIAFASELKALFAFPEVPQEVNESRIVDHLAGTDENQTATFYQEIYRLPPACWLTLNQQGVQINQYWNLANAAETRYSSDEEYAQAFRELFSSAITDRLHSDRPLGLALSGGLDSTAIVGLAYEQQNTRDNSPTLLTFSATFQNLPPQIRNQVDERGYIRSALDKFELPNQRVEAGAFSPLAHNAEMTAALSEPYFAPTLPIFWQVYQAVHKSGIRLYLEGFDGDVTVSHGLERFAELFYELRWNRLIEQARTYAARIGNGLSVRKVAWRWGLRPILQLSVDQLPEPLRKLSPFRSDKPHILRADLQKKHPGNPAHQKVRSSRQRNVSLSRQIHGKKLTSGAISRGLEITNQLAAQHQIQVSFPFFDRRVIEFCVGLPAEQKFNAGWTRSILRRSLNGIVPDRIRLRQDKANFSPYFTHNLINLERQRLDILSNATTHPIFAYIDRERYNIILQRFYAAPQQHVAEAEILYAALTLANWLQNFT